MTKMIDNTERAKALAKWFNMEVYETQIGLATRTPGGIAIGWNPFGENIEPYDESAILVAVMVDALVMKGFEVTITESMVRFFGQQEKELCVFCRIVNHESDKPDSTSVSKHRVRSVVEACWAAKEAEADNE